MKLVVIIGPQAVGKMTVGQELEKITGLKLFHNHMTIELVAPFFEYGNPSGQRLVDLFRKEIFEEVSKSNGKGLIFTYMWDFNEPEDREYLEELCSIFKSKGFEVYYVEMEADREERIKRNKSPHRLKHKPTKRDVDRSERELIDSTEKYRLNSHKGEITELNYLRINNTNVSAKKAAKMIKEKFNL
jgi:shikimate kinase